MFFTHESISFGFALSVAESIERTVVGTAAVDLVIARRWRSRTSI